VEIIGVIMKSNPPKLTMQVVIDLALHARVKTLAARSGRSVKETLEGILEAALPKAEYLAERPRIGRIKARIAARTERITREHRERLAR
jgi:hypothetical protein